MDSVFSLVGSHLGWDFKTLLLFTLIFIIAADFMKFRRPAGFPPGPWGLPIVGSMFSLDHTRTHEVFTQLAGKYGDMFSIRMGNEWLVVLNRFEAVKEGLTTKGDSMAHRPDIPMVQDISGGRGVLFNNGPKWREQRRFALSTLRYFGLGKKSLEPVILDEFRHCAEEFRSFNGKPFNPQFVINNAVSNVISFLVFGRRFEYSDEKFQELLGMFNEAFQIQASFWAQLFNSFPVLMRHLPGPHQTGRQIWRKVLDFVREEVNDHKKTWDPSNQRDFIDCYLKEIQMGKADSTIDEENLVVSVWDLFLAGTETTTTTMRWAFLYMVKYPEIQEKVQAEIDRVIGQSRQPSMEDRVNLPYTDAVIHEIQRMGNIVPLGIPHSTNREVQLGGYTIPQGVKIVPNLTSVMFDKDKWKTPFTFNPGHFLNKEGKFVKPEPFIPFSVGQRRCLGENLARMELFLLFTSFMQNFTFSMPAGVKPSVDFVFGVTLGPKNYEIFVTSRQE
ncbi:cytochrome P450 2J2-like [Acanthochromis polyacanthus]|uniref:cytochrome P450 2J2-like n=1 Tax=Acanthochromis polyacanthus TaxID=80966 RepID=UPI002234DA2D|nr:cytochrome P450 2J2-like [Acanthochromis polyacanthus]